MIHCLKPLLVIALPFLVAWLITTYTPIQSKWTLRFVALLVAVQVACFALLPMAMITARVAGEQIEATLVAAGAYDVTTMTVDGETAVAFTGQTAGLLPYAPGSAPLAFNEMHSRGGEWAGRDYTRPCGTPIYAPFDGTVQRGGSGVLDGWNNTYMYIRSADGRYDMLIMHSDFHLTAGDTFTAGQQIGATNTIGYSSECHEHISLLVDGVEVDPEKYRQQGTAVASVDVGAPTPYINLAGLAQALASLGYNASSDVALRISHYEPAAGGVNCDHDCGHMSSGDVTWDWTGGKGGIYAAACPPAWPFGTRFSYAGVTYECRDRGGWIQCYEPGDRDKAITSAHENGHLLGEPAVAQESYCWVDLYNTPPVGYGTLTRDWQFVN